MRSQRLADAERIGIILDVHGGSAQVDDAACGGALFGECAHFGHQVVVDFSFDLQCAGDVNFFRSSFNSLTCSGFTSPNSDWTCARATQIFRQSHVYAPRSTTGAFQGWRNAN